MVNAIFVNFQADHKETDSLQTVEEIETYAENTVLSMNYTLLKCAGNIEIPKINAIFVDFQADHIETDSLLTVEEIKLVQRIQCHH